MFKNSWAARSQHYSAKQLTFTVQLYVFGMYEYDYSQIHALNWQGFKTGLSNGIHDKVDTALANFEFSLNDALVHSKPLNRPSHTTHETAKKCSYIPFQPL